MTFDANSITDCEITSSGEQDLLTDDKKTAMAKAMSRANKREIFFIVVSSKLLRVLYCF